MAACWGDLGVLVRFDMRCCARAEGENTQCR